MPKSNNKKGVDPLERVEQIASIKRQRDAIKKQVDNIKLSLDQFDVNVNSFNEIKILRPVIDKLIDKHDKINERWLDLIDDREIDNATRKINELDNIIREVQSKILDYLDQVDDDNISSRSFGVQDRTIIPGNHLISSTMREPFVNAPTQFPSQTDINRCNIEHDNREDDWIPSHQNNLNQNLEIPTTRNNPLVDANLNVSNPIINIHNENNSDTNIGGSNRNLQNFNQDNSGDHHCNLNISQNILQPQATQTVPTMETLRSPQHYSPPQTVNNINNAMLNSKDQDNLLSQSPLSQPSSNFKPYKVKAPALEIPSFDGNPLKWLTFKQMFTTIIHNRTDMDDVLKFSYLLKHLTGKASLGLGHVTLTSVGYQCAWKQLLSEYDNNCILVDTHIDHLLHLPYCNKENSTDLRALFNSCQLHVSTLNALSFKMDNLSDRMLVNVIKKRLDPTTRKLWEEQQLLNEFPSFNSIMKFLQRRCQILESVESIKKPIAPTKPPNPKQTGLKSFATTSSSQTQNVPTNAKNSIHNNSSSGFNKRKFNYTCYICNKNHHKIFNCLSLLKLSIQDRINRVKEANACLNCLNVGHNLKDCVVSSSCKLCNHKHNTLLHLENSGTTATSSQAHMSMLANGNQNNINQDMSKVSSNVDQTYCTVKSYHQIQNKPVNSVLLSTAVILISNNKGSYSQCRVLLDSGSQSNFISSRLVHKLKLSKIPTKNSITLLNEGQTEVSHKVVTEIKSRINKFAQKIELQIVPIVTSSIPSNNINISRWLIPENIALADPSFNLQGPVDLLLGAEIYYKILMSNQIHDNHNQPILIETLFGWIFGGSYKEQNFNFVLTDNDSSENTSHDDLHSFLPKFWDIIDIPNQKYLSSEEQQCENYFDKTYSRDETGRFIVNLPLKENLDQLGESKSIALKRFMHLERKLNSNDQLKRDYKNFIDEYLQLNHMRLIDETVIDSSQKSFYLPHHCVIKPTSTTTKLRVVFDASAKSSSGVSLNDVLMVGPVVQDDLFSIVLRFRKHNVAFTSDIKKMYRQIKVCDQNTSLQRILWRDNVTLPISTFELTTVTYGTASAPYLATKSLSKLAQIESSNCPIASRVISEDFYVDDILSGTSNTEEALALYHELTSVLSKGCFELHKWSSNSSDMLRNIPEENVELLQADGGSEGESIRALGLVWKPLKDVFTFNIESLKYDEKFTKRSLLSNIAKLYDPLGLLSPTIILAKLLVQNLWKCKIDWDDQILEEHKSTWISYRKNLSSLENFELNRHVMMTEYDTVELHGFADASQLAYGACLYIKCIKDDQVTTSLLCSKSRVAPLKTITVARLELCAAVLLSQLTKKAVDSIKINFNSIQLWSDSEIVLAWIKTAPYKLKTFVANRVAEIQSLSLNEIWFHVSSADNPADLISRGVMPQLLVDSAMWWNGPPFLKTIQYPYSEKLKYKSDITEIDELKVEYLSENVTINAAIIQKPEFFILSKYESYTKLLRVTAYIRRFIHNFKNKYIHKQNNNLTGPLSCEEIRSARLNLISIIQQYHFSSEIKILLKNQPLPKSSNILNLNPFLDENNVLRVGGRLRNSEYDFDTKHQILIPHNHHFTDLLFRDYHVKNYHAGPNLLVSLVRQTFWPINAKQKAKKIVHNCVKCFKSKPVIANQIMGDLPKDRIKPCIPFNVTGVDFCGPFFIKNKYQRNSPQIKVYVAVFVCFTTKALHLEVVSDLTSESFIACLRRFIARRGKCSKLWSDNGTNFCGANNALKKEFKQFLSEDNFGKINKFLVTEEIDWNFIPPRSPNFGGLWESSVKSFKTHFKKIATNANLYYEEFNTIVIQIEGILNSRPLYPMSDDPNDPQVLTPGHFLRGAALNAPPEPSITHIPTNHLSRWQRVSQMVQLFWKKFSVEYLHNLQVRHKWKVSKNNIQIGDICLIKDENISPQYWMLGRIVKIMYGNDSHVRVVELKTQRGIISRAISNICPLPIEDNSTTSTSN